VTAGLMLLVDHMSRLPLCLSSASPDGVGNFACSVAVCGSAVIVVVVRVVVVVVVVVGGVVVMYTSNLYLQCVI